MNISENRESFKQHLISFYNTVKYHQEQNPELAIGPIADKYVDNEISMEEGMRQYFEYMQLLDKRNRRLLNAIKAVKGKTFHKRLLEIIKDSDGISGQAEIVKTPIGKYQKEDNSRSIRGIWVNQWAVGDSGDSWEGTVCVEIKPQKYLKFSYSM